MHHHDHFDPEQLAQREIRRREIFPPDQTLKHFLARPDLIMADVGCGLGYYAIEAAKMLTTGKVFAIDRQEDMLHWTKTRGDQSQLTNLITVEAVAEDIPLDSSTLDVVLMANVLHDLTDPHGAMNEVHRLLKPTGILFLVEWDKVPTDFGPPLEVRFSPSELITFVERYGFDRVQKIEAPSPWFQVMAHKPIP